VCVCERERVRVCVSDREGGCMRERKNEHACVRAGERRRMSA